MMNFQALCDLSGDGRVKGFIERSNGVNIQIIHDQHNLFTVAVMDLHQLTQEMGRIHGCPGVGQLYYSLAGQRFKRDEQDCHTAAAVFIILSPWTSGFRRNPPLLNKLPVCLIQADHRAQRIIRTLIYNPERPPSALQTPPLVFGMYHSFFCQGLSSFFSVFP